MSIQTLFFGVKISKIWKKTHTLYRCHLVGKIHCYTLGEKRVIILRCLYIHVFSYLQHLWWSLLVCCWMNKQFHVILFNLKCQSWEMIISCMFYYFDESDLSWSFLQAVVVLLVASAVRLLVETLELSFALLPGRLK